jgi:calcineurin-like phosphoesterase
MDRLTKYEPLARKLWESTKILAKYGVDTISTGDYLYDDISMRYDNTGNIIEYYIENKHNIARGDALYIVKDENCLEVSIYMRLTGKNSENELDAMFAVAQISLVCYKALHQGIY